MRLKFVVTTKYFCTGRLSGKTFGLTLIDMFPGFSAPLITLLGGLLLISRLGLSPLFSRKFFLWIQTVSLYKYV